MNTQFALQELLTAIQDELKASIPDAPLPLYNMVRYHMGWVDERGRPVQLPGGKLLRPLLCLVSCQAVGGDYRRALPAATAIELVHNFSLIHDDIQDRSPQRRHRPSVWCVWGEAQGITAGDGLHVLAHLALLRLEDKGYPPQVVLGAARLLHQACLSLCQGQHLDITFEGQPHLGLGDYLDMIGKKTAALFAASTGIGAMLGTDDQKVVEALAAFGEELGLAFQIGDDILGIWGEEGVTGKPSLADLRARKKSLPVVHAMAIAGGRDREVLEEFYGKVSPGDEGALAVLAVLEKAGSHDYCQALARSYQERARARLEALTLEREAAEALRDLAGRLAGRVT